MIKIEITSKNVRELWELYSEYLESYKANFRDEYYMNFEEYVHDKVIQCDQCEEYYDIDGDYVRRLQDADICDQCITNGWGQ